MQRTVFAVIALAVVFLATGLATAQHHGHKDQPGHNTGHNNRAAPATDTRVLVKFPPDLAAHTLANMRDHLMALQEITDALARRQHDKAGKISEQRLGMTSLRLHCAHEVAKYMPQGMRDAGTAMHRAASRFAIEAQNASVTGDVEPALRVLGEVMSACVGCHAGYKLK